MHSFLINPADNLTNKTEINHNFNANIQKYTYLL